MATDDAVSWGKWLNKYGAVKFYEAFMHSAQGARGICVNCRYPIYLDIREGGGVPDWRTASGDYGCDASPETNEDGCGGHTPEKLEGF